MEVSQIFGLLDREIDSCFTNCKLLIPTLLSDINFFLFFYLKTFEKLYEL